MKLAISFVQYFMNHTFGASVIVSMRINKATLDVPATDYQI